MGRRRYWFSRVTGFPLIMVHVNNLVLETGIYGRLSNSKSGKIRIKETQSQVFIAICESKNPGNPKIQAAQYPGGLKL